MSTVSNLIFHNEKHYVTSEYGYRKSITTSNGNTATFHSGTDYGTNGKKIAQYAIEDGEILSCGKESDGALYVWVKYPRLGVKLLHYHLDSIAVEKGQKVNKDTILGYTGKTGKATGIHLHLGVKKLSGGGYIDPEKWAEEEYTAPPKKTTTKKPSKPKAKFAKGDKVEVKKAVTYDGKSFKTYYDVYDVIDIKGDRVVIGVNGTVTAAVKDENLTKAASTSTAKKEVKVGSTVKVKKGAKTFNGGNLASFVYERNHKVKDINVDRVVITYNGIVIAAVRKSDLTVID